MNNYQKQFKKDIESIKLNSTEKSELFGNFKKMMSENPAPKNEAVLSPLGSIGFRFSDLRSYAYISMLVILVAGIGTTSAAEFTTPGDLLYPVKITINDRAVTALAFSPEAKAEAKVALVERRLAEVEDLIDRNEEDGENAERIDYLESKIEDYSDEAVEIIRDAKEVNRNKSIREKKDSENESRKVLARLGKAIDSHKIVVDKSENEDASTATQVDNDAIISEINAGDIDDSKESTLLEVKQSGIALKNNSNESVYESLHEISKDLEETQDQLQQLFGEDEVEPLPLN